jgi:polar amino acid transport system substrate-binding protein
MKNKKEKIFKGMILSLALLMGLAACGKNNEKAEKLEADTSQKEKVVVGLDNTFVPMGFLDEKNEVVGFDVDLAKEVFKRQGKEVTFENIDRATKEASLDRGSVDLLWNGYSINDERKKIVDYSDPYMDNKTIFVVMADSDIKSMDDLKEKEIGTQQGSTAYEALQKNEDFKNSLKNQDARVYDTFDKALRDLEVGRTQAVVGDEVLIRYYISQKGQEKYRILDQDLGSESYVVAFRKGDKKFRDQVNETLKEMEDDGTFQKIYDKWFDN